MSACDGDIGMCYRWVSVVSFDACAACFSLRAAFRVCHDFDSVFGFGFSFLCDSRLGGVVVDAMYPLSVLLCEARASPGEPSATAQKGER